MLCPRMAFSLRAISHSSSSCVPRSCTHFGKWIGLYELQLLNRDISHFRQAGHCRRDFGHTRRCIAIQGGHSCGIPVENLFAFYKIKLTAENQLIQASSSEECVHGMGIGKQRSRDRGLGSWRPTHINSGHRFEDT